MKPWNEMSSRERDAIVAEKVMGWFIREGGPNGEPCCTDSNQHEKKMHEIPPYTTDIVAAWEVVEKIQISVEAAEVKIHNTFDGIWVTDFRGYGTKSYINKAAPEAICLAALKAVGVDIK